MGEEFYSVIKLVTGEEIFSLVSIDENDGDAVLILQNPVIMKMIKNKNGMYIKIKNWMEIPDDDFFIIKYDKIVTMTEVKNPMVIGFYQKYLSDNFEILETDSTGKVKISNRMGYVSSVEDARKNLEKLYNDIKDNKES